MCVYGVCGDVCVVCVCVYVCVVCVVCVGGCRDITHWWCTLEHELTSTSFETFL